MVILPVNGATGHETRRAHPGTGRRHSWASPRDPEASTAARCFNLVDEVPP